MWGKAMATRLMASAAWPNSVRGCLRNFSRAGTWWNRSRTSTRVPVASAAGIGSVAFAPSTVTAHAWSEPGVRLVMVMRLTEPMDGKASPRKPRVSMWVRSPVGNFDVAWRSTARVNSPGSMPWPSSVTQMPSRPPSSRRTSMDPAPASMAFSTSSLTAAPGRSMTSPAAMRLIKSSGNRRI